jgi:hypothetical protein
VELKRLEDSVQQIHQEMKFLQQREQQMRSTNGNNRRKQMRAVGRGTGVALSASSGRHPRLLSPVLAPASLLRRVCASTPLFLAVRIFLRPDSTSSRVIWFSVVSMLVLVALNAGQILYLKKFFRSKKLIQ